MYNYLQHSAGERTSMPSYYAAITRPNAGGCSTKTSGNSGNLPIHHKNLTNHSKGDHEDIILAVGGQ